MTFLNSNVSFGRTWTRLGFVASLLALAACSNNDANIPSPQPAPPPPPPAMASFEITVTNLTNAQPLSPLAIVGHQEGYALFTIGAPASAGLEQLAEGGDNMTLLAEADAEGAVLATVSGAAPVGPAASDTLSVQIQESDLPGFRISVSSMLVNTNDAITGVSNVMVGGMDTGDSISMYGVAYDAGTEGNSELATDIPGPAGGGEGFNATRDDRADRVAMHSGVVSQDDGLETSNLSEQHRFDNPVALVSITRTD